MSSGQGSGPEVPSREPGAPLPEGPRDGPDAPPQEGPRDGTDAPLPDGPRGGVEGSTPTEPREGQGVQPSRETREGSGPPQSAEPREGNEATVAAEARGGGGGSLPEGNNKNGRGALPSGAGSGAALLPGGDPAGGDERVPVPQGDHGLRRRSVAERIDAMDAEEASRPARMVVVQGPRDTTQSMNPRTRGVQLFERSGRRAPIASPDSRDSGSYSEGDGGAPLPEPEGHPPSNPSRKKKAKKVGDSRESGRGSEDPAPSGAGGDQRAMQEQEREHILRQVAQWVPRPFYLCLPEFENEIIYTALPNENMEALMHRVHRCWDQWARHCLPESVILRTQVCPEEGTDSSFTLQTEEGLEIVGHIHRRSRKRFYDCQHKNPDLDPWQGGSLTILYLQDGMKALAFRLRKGPNKMDYAAQQWRGYTLFYKNTKRTGWSTRLG
eukprot:Skav236506  [mRNA]  locus=scaffold78:335647:336963:- [translate_table: standard]